MNAKPDLPAVVEHASTAMTPLEMLNRAIEKGVEMDVLTKLMDLHERWEKSQARKAFDAAIAAAKAEIPVIAKNKHVGFAAKNGGARTDYFHEDLAEIARTIDPILGRHGLSYRFRTKVEIDAPIIVTCVVSHRDGYFEENSLPGPRDATGNKNAIQQMGSTITYLQRYTLKASLGLSAGKDDDAQAAGEDAATTIDTDQVAELRKLIMDTDADLPKFLAFLEIEKLDDLPTARFAEAVTSLNARKAKQAQKRATKVEA